MDKPGLSPVPANPISAISHRLRTPLTVIMSTVNNFLDGAFGPLGPDQQKWIKKLESHTQSLESLLNDILGLLKSQPEKAAALQNSFLQQESLVSQMMHPAKGEAAGPIGAASQGGTPTVLIVDDEPDIREVIEEG